MKKIALFGYSGHAYVVADAIKLNGNKLLGYYDFREAALNPYGMEYLGDEHQQEALNLMKEQQAYAVVSVGENNIRQRVMEFLQQQEVPFARVIHPAGIVSSMAALGEGCFVGAGAVVNAMAAIGTGGILNTGCIIEHECEIDSFVHIAPGAVLAGNVRVGAGSFVGANAVVKQGVSIGSNVIIGAGSVVLKDVPDNQIWVGNPAREKRK